MSLIALKGEATMYQNELKQGLNTVTEEGAIRSEESDLGNKKRKSLGEIYEETDRMLEMFWHLLNQGYQKLKYGEFYEDEGYIFTQDNGKPIHPDNLDRLFIPIEKKHPELPHIKCHEFRHSIATWLIGEGNDIASVSAMLGHSNPNTTLGFYTHATERGREAIAKSLSSLEERIS